MKKICFLISVLFLSFNVMGMQIYVDTPSSGKIALEAESNDTVENIKAKIEDKIGIKPGIQILKFNDVVLEEGKTLKDYTIGNESTLQLTLANLGLNSLELNKSILFVYPNPSNSYISISNLKESKKYTIINNLGQEIFKGDVTVTKKEINIGNLVNGIYFLMLENGSSLKFIKK